MAIKNQKDRLAKAYSDLRRSEHYYSKLKKEVKRDFEFVQGKQWDEDSVEELRKAGVKALTINKLKPIIKLITGIERQSKSDLIAFPEGGEDNLKADVATRLIKHQVKVSRAEIKLSETFKAGAIAGPSYLEPYIDYTHDLINGELRFKRLSPLNIFLDPDGQEYDLSDHRFVGKLTPDLTEEDLVALFPDKESQIKKIENGQISLDKEGNFDQILQKRDYDRDSTQVLNIYDEKTFDLVDYYYKRPAKQYFVLNSQNGDLSQPFNTKEEALNIADQSELFSVIEQTVQKIYLMQFVGQTVLYDDIVWTYPSWKSYPIIPFFAEYLTDGIDDRCLTIQGVVRGIKDLQEEFNKRRTQELRHLNASANSGFDIEDDQLDDQNEKKLTKFGSSPGIVIKRKKGTPPVGRITPMPLSQGHVQLAEENAQDLKQASGVDPDLLASTSNSQSGRAILLKQRQGLVMIQEILDNFSITKEMVGKFIISQFSELFTVDSAMRVLGDKFIAENFSVPVSIILQRGLEKMEAGEQPTQLEESVMLQYPNHPPQEPIADEEGNLETAVDFDQAITMINTILNDTGLGKYDVSVGEGPFNETTQISNFLELTDLAKQGIPIPPDVIIEMSNIPENKKQEIIQKLAQQAALAAQQGE